MKAERQYKVENIIFKSYRTWRYLIGAKIALKIDWSVKTLWQEYMEVACS